MRVQKVSQISPFPRYLIGIDGWLVWTRTRGAFFSSAYYFVLFPFAGSCTFDKGVLVSYHRSPHFNTGCVWLRREEHDGHDLDVCDEGATQPGLQ